MKLIESVKLDDIYRFLETGNPDNAPEEIVYYLELLSKIDGMIRRIDRFGSKKIVINHLIITEKLSEYKAKQMYDEAIEYFYNDTTITLKSWSNFYADIIDQEINFMRLVKKDTADSKRIIDAAKTAFEVRGGNKEQQEELPPELFQKPWVVYTTDVETLGMAKVDRNRIKEFIDKKVPELTEKERQRLYMEADIIPFKALPNDEENPRKN
ncbi:hypothetical protein [Flavobacterium koreense]